MRFLLFLSLFLVGAATSLMAQIPVKFGLRAGANFATMMGPSETDTAGNKLETNRSGVRLIAGAVVKIPITERFGFTTELSFVQKGAYYRYEGDSYLKLPAYLTQAAYNFEGHKRVFGLNVTNGYIEVPAMFYFEPIDDRLQVDLGATIGILVSSRGLGTLKYTDPNYPNSQLEFDLDYRFLKDTAAHVRNVASRTGVINGNSISIPSSIGAYYFNSSKKGGFYNPIDFSVNLGVSYYVTNGLRFGLRAQYGLTDITNNFYDVSKYKLDASKNYIPRKDIDRNFGVQVFLGLQF